MTILTMHTTIYHIVHYEYMAIAKQTSVLREAVLLLFQPRRLSFGAAEYARICWSHVKQAICSHSYIGNVKYSVDGGAF